MTDVREAIRQKLLALNQSFYEAFAQPFAQSRANPQPGFSRLLPYVAQGCERVLDVGCGEGRFGRFLLAERPGVSYVGVDFSPQLLQRAEQALPAGTFYCRDISQEGSLQDLGRFCLVTSLAVLQHIPSRARRAQVLGEMSRRLTDDGRLFLSTWQFLDSERQRRKIVEWERAGIADDALEANDYLLTWGGGGQGLRYVAYIDHVEVQVLAEKAGLVVVDAFRSDGREGDLNLYSVLRARKTGQSVGADSAPRVDIDLRQVLQSTED